MRTLHRFVVVLLVCGGSITMVRAENGKLLSRTELLFPSEVFRLGRISPGLSNAIQQTRFWKFTYESDGLKVGGYMAAAGEHRQHFARSTSQIKSRDVT